MKTKIKIWNLEFFNLLVGIIIDLIQFLNIKSINTMALLTIGSLLIFSAIISFGIRKFNEYDLKLRYRKFCSVNNQSQRQFKPELHIQFSDIELIKLIKMKEISFSELEYHSPYQN